MDERPAPDQPLPPDEAAAVVESFTAAQRQQIALTLDDLRGWGTLHGRIHRFDPLTGDQLDPPVKLLGWYDRPTRRGLPENWPEMFIQLGWIDIAHTANGTAWQPTGAGLEIHRRWLPDHLRDERQVGPGSPADS